MTWLWWAVVLFDAGFILLAIGASVGPALVRFFVEREGRRPPVEPWDDAWTIPVRSRAFVPRSKRVAPPYRPGRRPFGG